MMITARPGRVSAKRPGHFTFVVSVSYLVIEAFYILGSIPSTTEQAVQDSRCYLENGGSVESFFVSEDIEVGSIIGTLSVNGDPRERVGNIALSLKEKESPVKISPGTKNLTLVLPLDKEGVTGPSSVYVNVICDRKRTNDPGFVIPVSIRVTDANDNAPQWSGAPYRARLSELTAGGTRVLQGAKASDADQPGKHSTVEYHVIPGTNSSERQSRMEIKDFFSFLNELEGTLVLKKPLDYENLPNFTVGLRAQDQGSPPKYTDTVLYVEVLDADDQNPKFLDDHYTSLLPDNASRGYELNIHPRAISAFDQDLGINAALFYTLNSDQGFAIDRETAKVTLAKELDDDDSGMPVTLVVKATQYDNPDRYALSTLTVSKRSVGKRPVQFAQNLYHAAVLENLPVGSVLMTLNTNRLRDRSLKYYVSDRKFLTKFAINAVGEVVLRKSLDYETDDKYSFQVMVSDGQANDTASINITVLNVNDWDPRFRYPQYEFFINPTTGDQADVGLPLFVGKVEAADGDKGDYITLSLRGSDANLFFINENGEVYMKETAISHLNSTLIHVVAVATDSGVPPRQTSVPVIVHVSEALMASYANFNNGSTHLFIIFGGVLSLLAVVIVFLIGYIYRVRRRSKSAGRSNKVGSGYVQHEKLQTNGLTPPTTGQQTGTNGSGVSIGHSGNLAGNLASVTHALGAASGSLLSVSAGASTILANSSSSLNLNLAEGERGKHLVNGCGDLVHGGTSSTLPAGLRTGIRDLHPNDNYTSTVKNMAARSSGRLPGQKSTRAPSPPGHPGPGVSAQLALMSDHVSSAGGAGGRSGVAWPSATIPARVKKLSWDDDDAKNGTESDPSNESVNRNTADQMNLTVYF